MKITIEIEVTPKLVVYPTLKQNEDHILDAIARSARTGVINIWDEGLIQDEFFLESTN